MFFLLISVSFLVVLSGCRPSSETNNQQPVDVASAVNVISAIGSEEPINPAGPTVEITLKNVSDEPATSLTATLELYQSFEFSFDVTPSSPLMSGDSINSRQVLIQGAISENASYPLKINVILQNGDAFVYTKQIQFSELTRTD